MSNFSSTLKAYLNFVLELRSFLRQRETIEESKVIVRQQLANREENFLNTLRTNVYNYPKSPYLPLLQAANITHDDVIKMVSQHGLEGALEELFEAGVYVTFEEIKGREPIKRNGVEYNVTASDFDNPNLKPLIFGRSGGSTGAPTRTKIDLDHIIQNGRSAGLTSDAHDILGLPTVAWFGLLPIPIVYTMGLRLARMGYTIEKWYTPMRTSTMSSGWYYTVLSYLMVLMIRLHGHRFPFPEYAPHDNPLPITQWIADSLQKHGKCELAATISKAIRICLTAEKHNLNIQGLIVRVGGEPISEAKVAILARNGVKVISLYMFSEAGAIGMGCANPSRVDDLHFMSHHIALIQRPVKVFDQTVDAFCFTSLHPNGPKMLLNAQSDDYGVIEERDCGCPLYEIGFHHHFYDVHSYRKLTAEGMTLVGSDMVNILETVLPEKFGGSLLDYQLVEEEVEHGLTRLFLYVDPSVPITDNQMLVNGFLDALKNSKASAQLAQTEYRQAETIVIRRQAPIRTSRDKHFPIRTLKQSQLKSK